MSDIPQGLIDFVTDYGGAVSSFTLDRMLSRDPIKYQHVDRWRLGSCQPIPSMADTLHRAAHQDLKGEKVAESTYRITIRTGNQQRSKHFVLRQKVSPEDRCDDCKGSGWYVGIVERRPCPTCDGTGSKR